MHLFRTQFPIQHLITRPKLSSLEDHHVSEYQRIKEAIGIQETNGSKKIISAKESIVTQNASQNGINDRVPSILTSSN